MIRQLTNNNAKLSLASAPTVGDRTREGKIWIKKDTNEAYILLDVTAGVATWDKLVTASGYLPMDLMTDPALNSALTTAKLDAYSGVIILTTGAGNDQTFDAPTDTTPGKRYWVINDDSSTHSFNVVGARTITIDPGEAEQYMYDGTAWIHITAADAEDITYNPASSYLTDTNVQSAFDTVFTSDGILFTKGSQDYLFTDRGTNLAIQGQWSTKAATLELFSKDGDASVDVAFNIWGLGTPTNVTNAEYLKTWWDASDNVYSISSLKIGTGTVRGIRINATGTVTDNQLYLATGGQNIMGHNASIISSDGEAAKLQVISSGADGKIMVARFASSAAAPVFDFLKSHNSTIGSNTILSDNDFIGSLRFLGDDGVNYQTNGAQISARVNGTPNVAGNRMPTDLEFYTALGGADDDLALSAKLQKDAMLDLYGGTISILAGAEDGAKTRGDNATKVMRFGIPHKDNEDVPMAVIYGESTAAGGNNLFIGGGDASMNASTVVAIYAADGFSTTTGTEVARFEGGAATATRMGLGNSSLESWHLNYSALQIGGLGSIIANTAVGTGKVLNLYNNGYINASGAETYITTDEATKLQSANGDFTFVVYDGSAGAGNAMSADATTALTIANDASSTFGGNVTTSGRMRADGSLAAPAFSFGADTDTGIYPISDGVIGMATNGVAKQIWNAGANGLITLSGGTGGVRLDNTVGIGVAPDLNYDLNVGRTYTATDSWIGLKLKSTITGVDAASKSLLGMFIDGDFIAVNSVNAIPRAVGVQVNNFDLSIIDGGSRTVDILAGLYIPNAPTITETSGTITVTNGPYSIFVDAGDVRFDGGFVMGGGTTPQAQQPHIVDADGTLADLTTKFNTLLADLEGFGFLATS